MGEIRSKRCEGVGITCCASSSNAHQVIPTPSHLLDRISPIFSPKIPVFCAFSPSRRGGSNEPKTGIQGQETVARAPKHRFAGLANSGCSERGRSPRADALEAQSRSMAQQMEDLRQEGLRREKETQSQLAAILEELKKLREQGR